MNNAINNLLKQLCLPDPNGRDIADDAVRGAYVKFCNGLILLPSGQAVLADADVFSLSLLADGDLEAVAMLKVLGALIRPKKDYLSSIHGRTFDIEDVYRQQGKFSGFLYDSNIARSFKAFADFQNTSDFEALTKNAVELKCLGSLQSELASAPGLTWLSRIDFISWNSEWGLVLHYGDSENNQYDAFPSVLGFFSMAGYPYSAAALLAALPDCRSVYDEAFVYGDDLLALCWKRFGDEGCFNIAGHLLDLNVEDIEKLQKFYGGFFSSKFVEDMERIWADASEARDADWHYNVLNDMAQEHGLEGLLKLFKSFREEERRIQWEQEKVERARERADLEMIKSVYWEVAPKSPDQFSPDKKLHSLSLAEQQSLQKWLCESQGLKDSWVGIHYLKSRRRDGFVLAFRDERGREFRHCNQGVTLHEAFRQLFASFYEKHVCPNCSGRNTYIVEYTGWEKYLDESKDDFLNDDKDPDWGFSNERWTYKIEMPREYWLDEVIDDDFEMLDWHCGDCESIW